MAAIHGKNSFLRRTPVYDFYLDISNLPKIPKSIADKEYTIESKYDERPDLLAYKLYGSTRLWWVFSLRNPDVLVDPIRDFKSGTVIYLPTDDTIRRVVG